MAGPWEKYAAPAAGGKPWEKYAAPQQPAGWTPQADADLAEKITGSGTYADMTGSGIAKAIPFGDEIASGLNAPFRAARDWYQGDGFDIGRAYDRNMQVEEELQRRREERSPIASTVGTAVGRLGATAPLAAGGLSFMAGAKPTLGSLVGRGAAEGAAYGAAYGAGEGRGVDERLRGAGWGAAVGAGAGAGTGAVARALGSRVASDAAPSVGQLRDAGRAAYQAADDAGVIFTPTALGRLRSGIVDDFTDFGFLPSQQPGAAAVLKEIERVADGNVTLKGLDTIRKMAGNAYMPGNKPNNALVQKVIGRIDDMVAAPAADDILMGNAEAGAAALKEARSLWSQASKADQIGYAMEKARLRTSSTGTGGNLDNATRQELRKVLERGRGFTEAEKEALRQVVSGTAGQNALRLIGRLSPEGNGLMTMLGVGGMMVNPAMGAASAAGWGAKRLADGMTQNNAAVVDALIRSGGKAPVKEISPAMKAIADALMRAGVPQLPGYTGR